MNCGKTIVAEIKKGMTTTEVSPGMKTITFTKRAFSLLGDMILEGIHNQSIERHLEFSRWKAIAEDGRLKDIPERVRIREAYPASPFDFAYPRAYFGSNYGLAS